jgi:hypothetical protein
MLASPATKVRSCYLAGASRGINPRCAHWLKEIPSESRHAMSDNRGTLMELVALKSRSRDGNAQEVGAADAV